MLKSFSRAPRMLGGREESIVNLNDYNTGDLAKNSRCQDRVGDCLCHIKIISPVMHICLLE